MEDRQNCRITIDEKSLKNLRRRQVKDELLSPGLRQKELPSHKNSRWIKNSG
jgi:hypothetical protein